ncbi:MAG: BtrH N-terminal domain-containing protein, partial [Myxococcales bacterium]|nr:BtrH N-terminal domain-containing protein [Myxococcales bacterium]
MTRQSTFKSKIRARMRKTGERYAAARLALLSQREPTSAPIPIPPLPGYQFAPGVEPDLGLLTAALAQAGVIDPMTGAPFTEARLFGLSGGIGFMYFLFEYQGHPPMMTFTCRSWSMPEPVITRALTHAGIEAARSETSSAKVASAFVDDALAEGRVIHLTADAASLPSAGVPELWIGQLPRQLNVVGVQGDDVLVDFNAPIVLSRALLARARAACRKEKHRAWTFPKGQAKAAPVAATRAAVRATARSFVEAPYKGFAGNFGLAGLEKAARLCADPKDKKGWARVFHSGPLAYRALYRTWECATLELTPPAGGRSFYAQFLRDAAARCDLPALAEAAALAE